ncbi:hypothetical protein D3C73_1416520 [compost metagenome]
MVAGVVRIARHGRQGVLAGDHQPFAAALGEPPEQGLCAAIGVVVCGIDEVAAAFDVGIEDAAGLGFVRAPTPVGTEGHRAQRHRADTQAGAAEQAVVIK